MHRSACRMAGLALSALLAGSAAPGQAVPIFKGHPGLVRADISAQVRTPCRGWKLAIKSPGNVRWSMVERDAPESPARRFQSPRGFDFLIERQSRGLSFWMDINRDRGESGNESFSIVIPAYRHSTFRYPDRVVGGNANAKYFVEDLMVTGEGPGWFDPLIDEWMTDASRRFGRTIAREALPGFRANGGPQERSRKRLRLGKARPAGGADGPAPASVGGSLPLFAVALIGLAAALRRSGGGRT